jgi:hypothetical protein
MTKMKCIHLFNFRYFILILANLAQLVEQLIRNEQVAGSIPAVGSNLLKTNLTTSEAA